LFTDHQHFEELCALIAAGQASEDHLLEWREHAQECVECRSLRSDFEQTARAILVSDNKRAPRYKVPAGMTERFVAHARSAGVPLSRKEAEKRPQVRSSRRLAFYMAMATALIVLLAFLSWMLSVKLNGLRSLHPLVVLDSPVKNSPAAGSSGNSILRHEDSQLEGQLRDALAEKQLLLARFKDMQHARELAERKSLEISARLDELQNGNAELRRTEKDRIDEIAQLRERLEGVNAQRDTYRAATLVQEKQLSSFQDKVEELSSELTEAQELNTAANQAKDLIVARNLHILDVHDANEDGRQQRAFGRIFYTEGKSLVFYAYDLANPKNLNAKINFYVWGEKLGTTQPLKSLGIFHADDKTQGRWVLTFDDPHVLAEINSVFVTTESGKKAAPEPRGKRILAAFLGDKANHP
jgi:hypothetical protein